MLDRIKSTAIILLLMFSAIVITFAMLRPPRVEIREVQTEVPIEVEKIVPQIQYIEKIKYLPKPEIEAAFAENPEEMPILPEAPEEKVLVVKEFSVPVPARIVATGTINTVTGEGNILVKQFPIDMADSNLNANAKANIKAGVFGEWGVLDGTEIYLDYSTQGKVYGLRQNIVRAGWVRADAYIEGGNYSFYDSATGFEEQRDDVVLGVQVSVSVDKIIKVFKK